MNEQTRYRVTGAIFLLAIAILVLPMVFDGQGVRVKQLPELSEPLPPMPTNTELEALVIPGAEVDAHRAEQAVTDALLDEEGFSNANGTRLGDPSLYEVPVDSVDSVDGPAVVERSAEPSPAANVTEEEDSGAAPTAESTIVARLQDELPQLSTPPQLSKSPRLSTPPRRRAPAVPPDEAGKASKSLAKQPIWAVQLASFASPVNATALRDKLLQDGFEAWTSTARKDAVVRTRVAIGPLLDRRDAERMRDLVSGRYSVSAIVVHMEP